MGSTHGVAQLRKHSLVADAWGRRPCFAHEQVRGDVGHLATLVSVMATRISFQQLQQVLDARLAAAASA